jgi:hypothetical protein
MKKIFIATSIYMLINVLISVSNVEARVDAQWALKEDVVDPVTNTKSFQCVNTGTNCKVSE